MNANERAKEWLSFYLMNISEPTLEAIASLAHIIREAEEEAVDIARTEFMFAYPDSVVKKWFTEGRASMRKEMKIKSCPQCKGERRPILMPQSPLCSYCYDEYISYLKGREDMREEAAMADAMIEEERYD